MVGCETLTLDVEVRPLPWLLNIVVDATPKSQLKSSGKEAKDINLGVDPVRISGTENTTPTFELIEDDRSKKERRKFVKNLGNWLLSFSQKILAMIVANQTLLSWNSTTLAIKSSISLLLCQPAIP